MLLRLLPDALLADSGRLLRHFGVEVRGGRIRRLGPVSPAAPGWRRFPGELWAPSPFLLHAHLESWDAPSVDWPRSSFAEWAARLLSWRSGGGRLSPSRAATRSLQELRDHGCGFVLASRGEDGAEPDPGWEGPPELRLIPEVFAPDPEEAEATLSELAGEGRTWAALHAPFSVSPELARRVFRSFPRVSIHLGEHEEERRFLAAGEGPLATLFRARGRPAPAGRWPSPVDWLADTGGLRSGVLAVHGSALSGEELARLHGAGVRVVWCPGTHAWFGRAKPAFAASGFLPAALGCDSRASNEALSPLHEFRCAHRLLPEVPVSTWWRILTRGGAEVLGRAGEGRLAPGSPARFLRLPFTEDSNGGDADTYLNALAEDPAMQPLGPIFQVAGADPVPLLPGGEG